MKCPRCNGNGSVPYHTADDLFDETNCPLCGGSGEIKQTNEEFLRTASANDMARCIATKLLELARHEYGIYDVVDYANVFEWLKQPHTKGVAE